MVHERELNRKLAEWMEQDKTVFLSWRNQTTLEPRPHHRPNFTQSLDACFKGLVPKLKCLKLECDMRGGGTSTIAHVWYYHKEYELTERAFAETPALALCLAIEKLIDSKEAQ